MVATETNKDNLQGKDKNENRNCIASRSVFLVSSEFWSVSVNSSTAVNHSNGKLGF